MIDGPPLRTGCRHSHHHVLTRRKAALSLSPTPVGARWGGGVCLGSGPVGCGFVSVSLCLCVYSWQERSSFSPSANPLPNSTSSPVHAPAARSASRMEDKPTRLPAHLRESCTDTHSLSGDVCSLWLTVWGHSDPVRGVYLQVSPGTLERSFHPLLLNVAGP